MSYNLNINNSYERYSPYRVTAVQRSSPQNRLRFGSTEREFIDSVKKSIYYHGTSKKNADSIREGGLQIQSDPIKGCSHLLNSISREDLASRKYVYVTQNLDEAAMYAKMHITRTENELGSVESRRADNRSLRGAWLAQNSPTSSLSSSDNSSGPNSPVSKSNPDFSKGEIVSLIIPDKSKLEKDPEAASMTEFETQAYRSPISIGKQFIMPRQKGDLKAAIKNLIKTTFGYQEELSAEGEREIIKILSAVRPRKTKHRIEKAVDFLKQEKRESQELVARLPKTMLEGLKEGESLNLSFEELESLGFT